jgi:hypothetical protein
MREYSSKATPAEPAEDVLAGYTFSLDGDEFTCGGGTGSSFRLSAAARDARAGDEAAEMSMLAEAFAQCLAPEEYTRFARHLDEHGTPDEVVIAILTDIGEEAKARTEAQTGRPTTRRPTSSGGPRDREERMQRVINLQSGDVTVIRDERAPAQPARARAKRKAG